MGQAKAGRWALGHWVLLMETWTEHLEHVALNLTKMMEKWCLIGVEPSLNGVSSKSRR